MRVTSILTAGIARVSRLARRHALRVWLLWGLGVLVLVAAPVALVDPPVLVLLVDPELLALIVVSLAGLVHVRPRGHVASRIETTVDIRPGA